MRLPETRTRDERELLLQAALLGPFSAIEGYTWVALERAAARAVELGGQIGADSQAQSQSILARMRLALAHTLRGKLRTGLALLEEILAFAKIQEDPLLLSQSHYLTGLPHLWLGDVAAARGHFQKGLALYDPERDRAKAALYAADAWSSCHALLGLVLWAQAFPDDALRHAEEAIAAAPCRRAPLKRGPCALLRGDPSTIAR